jgi:hypothetical protein
MANLIRFLIFRNEPLQKLKNSTTQQYENRNSRFRFCGAYPPGAIVDQVPEARARGKAEPYNFVSINSTQPEMVTVPQLTDISFARRQVIN